MAKPQPYRVTWNDNPKTLEDLNRKLAFQMEHIDEMFQTIYTNAAQVEEGNWTPIDLSGSGFSFDDKQGHYIKIGQLVIATGYVKYPTNASGNSAKIAGLPFTPVNTGKRYYFGGYTHWVSDTTAAQVWIDETGSYVAPLTTAGGFITNATMSADVFHFTVIYRTNS